MKRYNLADAKPVNEYIARMVEDPDGEWCRNEDVEKLEAFSNLKTELIDGFRADKSENVKLRKLLGEVVNHDSIFLDGLPDYLTIRIKEALKEKRIKNNP